MPFTVIPLTCQEKRTLSLSDAPEWGLEHTLRPRFGARLVQEGGRLHFLADRAGVTGTFSATVACHLEHRFPLIVKQLEQKLVTGELDPCRQQRVTLHDGVLTCEADTLGSAGYVYITIYPTTAATPTTAFPSP
ncbi:type IV toxin-antitoxin system YeeU family antitoxin [Dickeya oryzae]